MSKKFRVWNKEGSVWLDPAWCSITGDGKVHSLQKPFGGLSGEETSNKVIVEFDTGLKDNKRTKEFPDGQPIYEADLVSASIYSDEKPQILEVEYVGSAFVINYEDSESDTVLLSEFVGSIEVVGNVHEDSGLLKEL